ncbi:MAG: AraC family transcriptional regulator [Oscillospiraceae bacterium]|nr:AraC family transcriptional regulator [Oscillospiraceae bacterium]
MAEPDDLMLQNLSQTAFAQRILNAGDEQGSFIETTDGQSYFYVYKKMTDFNWYYVSYRPYANIVAKARWQLLLTLLVSISFNCVGILLAFIITKSVSKPVHLLEEDLWQMQKAHHQDQPMVESVLLRRFLDGAQSDLTAADLQTLSGYLNCRIHLNEGCLLIWLTLDNYARRQINDEQLRTYKFAMINVFEELLERFHYVHGVDMGDANICLLLIDKAPVTRAACYPVIKEAQQKLQHFFPLTFTVFIATYGNRITDLGKQYRQVTELALHKRYYPYGSLIEAADHPYQPAESYIYPLQLEHQLTEAILLGKAERAQALYKQLIWDLAKFPAAIYDMAVARITVTINNCATQLSKNLALPSLALPLQPALNQADQVEAALEPVNRFFSQLAQATEQRKQNHQEDLLQQIKTLIELNYQDPDFMVEQIARQLDKTLPYISRFYSQSCGQSIKETITEKRIAKARELLKQARLPVQDVAQQVGFANPNYFYKIFKRMNGVTPVEYRRQQLREQAKLSQTPPGASPRN